MKIPPILASDGIVLMDTSSLKLIALDRGAAAILNDPNRIRGKAELGGAVPEEIVKVLKNGNMSDLSSIRAHLRIGKYGYFCRMYLMESQNRTYAQSMVALHLQRNSSGGDAVSEIADRYNLTEREQEALMGVSIGLTCKEVGERMNISPNTVKAYLRLIMIKMGVTRRAGIMSKLLEHNANGHNGKQNGSSPHHEEVV